MTSTSSRLTGLLYAFLGVSATTSCRDEDSSSTRSHSALGVGEILFCGHLRFTPDGTSIRLTTDPRTTPPSVVEDDEVAAAETLGMIANEASKSRLARSFSLLATAGVTLSSVVVNAPWYCLHRQQSPGELNACYMRILRRPDMRSHLLG